jgi:hypothetical protein
MSIIREIHAGDWCVRLDIGRQVLRLEIPEAVADWRHRGRRQAGPPLSPLLPLTADGPVSAATLLLKSKQFDDRLYAAVELAAQNGAGRFTGKAWLLRTLAESLAAGLPDTSVRAATAIHVACELGGLTVALPAVLIDAVRRATADFLRDERLSRPLGFYSWTPALSAIFHQDRYLQQPLDPETADSLTSALQQTPGAQDAYALCLRLAARLTNPPKNPGLRDVGKRLPFLAPSFSHEVALLELLYEDKAIPEGFDLMAELIRRVRSGAVDLNPTDQSGWYDHQTWSLEPLIVPDRMPERSRLEQGKRYRKHLEDLFRGALALSRETHVKQAGMGAGGFGGSRQPPIWVGPSLSVEPLPSLYARRASGYRFVRSVLEEVFGADTLHGMHGLTPEGPATANLAEELEWIANLFAGAAASANRELGIRPPGEAEGAVDCFSAWKASLSSDEDVSRDARMMVPVFWDVQREKTKVWAFLAWRTTPVMVDYRVRPNVLGVDPSRPSAKPAGEPPVVLFAGDRYELAVPVMAEVYVSRLLDRDEFRRHCDRFRTREAILANLR